MIGAVGGNIDLSLVLDAASTALARVVWRGVAQTDLDEALALELPGVTRFVLKEIAQRLENPDRPALFMRFRGRRSKVTAI